MRMQQCYKCQKDTDIAALPHTAWCLLLQAVAAGTNIEKVLLGPAAGAEQLLASQEQLDGLLAAANAVQQQLHAATMARLTAKLLVSKCGRLYSS
jgi:hypothetical protein